MKTKVTMQGPGVSSDPRNVLSRAAHSSVAPGQPVRPMSGAAVAESTIPVHAAVPEMVPRQSLRLFSIPETGGGDPRCQPDSRRRSKARSIGHGDGAGCGVPPTGPYPAHLRSVRERWVSRLPCLGGDGLRGAPLDRRSGAVRAGRNREERLRPARRVRHSRGGLQSAAPLVQGARRES